MIFLGNFWEASGNASGNYWENIKSALGTFWDFSGSLLGAPLGNPLGTAKFFWDASGTFLGHFWEPLLGAFWEVLGALLGRFWESFWDASGTLLGVYWEISGTLLGSSGKFWERISEVDIDKLYGLNKDMGGDVLLEQHHYSCDSGENSHSSRKSMQWLSSIEAILWSRRYYHYHYCYCCYFCC